MSPYDPECPLMIPTDHPEDGKNHECPLMIPYDPDTQRTARTMNVLIVPNGMGHMDWVCDSWHLSRIVPPRRDLQRLAKGPAKTRLSRLYLPGGTIPPQTPQAASRTRNV